MRESFILYVKPFSINSLYYKDKRLKTREAVEWSAQVFNQLSSDKHQAQLEALRNAFNASKQSFSVALNAFYPAQIFFNKKGSISAKTHDVSNWEKPLIDLIFLPKYFEQEIPYGCKNLNIDDRYIDQLASSKQVSTDDFHRIEVCIEIKELADPLSRKQDSSSSDQMQA